MLKLKKLHTYVLGFGLFSATLIIDSLLSTGLIIKEAEALIGRPLTPVSYAGVARRTTRRAIYRTSVYVASR